ncbi:cytochrome-c peroxidase [Marinibactrum halimedae]|uniref:Methylamine utilization protein n=1 Tax=Marinibactrum halimedae TaxID=1444977 RepID=A0AA37WKU4_9GAMM|nr:cytochrome c peroxidase [Marinibactrum halimedae]MCD9458061.1 hypothetical protein [Marinibactrum halimedae]GLS24994.1 methylamine utilization protein [Marinibactrum halimedae]
MKVTCAYTSCYSANLLTNLFLIFLLCYPFSINAQEITTFQSQKKQEKEIKNTDIQSKNHNALYEFTPSDIQFLSQFSLSTLPEKPTAPSNQYADNVEVAKLGQKLFFDQRLSRNGKVSCATCHQPEHYFSDGLPQSQGLGQTLRNAPSVALSAYGPWQYWDGRKDSLWSQALAPLEHPNEHGIDRVSLAKKIYQYYAKDYTTLFGKDELSIVRYLRNPSAPNGTDQQKRNWQRLTFQRKQAVNTVFTNVGKSLMAYQRQITLPLSPFDHFIETLIATSTIATNIQESKDNIETLKSLMSPSEISGLRLFMGKANCVSCHNGPLFTNFEFHNIGAPEPDITAVDLGRYSGVKVLLNDEFTCLSQWSDATEKQCEEMAFLKKQGPELVGAFKTPSLRNVAKTAPYMQAGQLPTLDAVLQHYNQPKPPFYDREQHPNRPHFDILPLELSEDEVSNIIAFLQTLTSPLPKEDPWWNAL